MWYGAQSPARLICPAASGLAGARDVGLDPGHAKGRRLAPGATLHMSQNGMWGDRHAQAGQRPSSTQSEAEPLTLRIATSLTWHCSKLEIVAVRDLTIAAILRQLSPLCGIASRLRPDRRRSPRSHRRLPCRALFEAPTLQQRCMIHSLTIQAVNQGVVSG